MASQPPQLPDSVVLGQFAGLKNTVAPERLTAQELEKALNVDIDDSGQVRRRRGYTLAAAGSYHSLYAALGRVYGVKNSQLGLINPDYSFTAIVAASDRPISYTTVAETIYFSSATHAGTITENVYAPWGAAVDGVWLSPVITPTDTLGAISGRMLHTPPKATQVEAYSGRIYLALDKTLWATELYQYHYTDRTRNFMQLEDPITLVMAVNDGLYVGTDRGLYFLKGVFGKFQLQLVAPGKVLSGSGVRAPAEQVHPAARQGAVPAGEAIVCMTENGVIAGFDGGTCYNLTSDRMIFPGAMSAAALLRQTDGVTSYVAVADSAGGPASKARIGDYVDAEIVRFGG